MGYTGNFMLYEPLKNALSNLEIYSIAYGGRSKV